MSDSDRKRGQRDQSRDLMCTAGKYSWEDAYYYYMPSCGVCLDAHIIYKWL